MSDNNIDAGFISKILFLIFLICFSYLPESMARDKNQSSGNNEIKSQEANSHDGYSSPPKKHKKRKGQVDHITNKLLADLHEMENEVDEENNDNSKEKENATKSEAEINLETADSHNPDMIESIGRGNLRTMPYAEMIVLNKITTKSEKIIFKVGEVRFFNNISIEVNKCVNNPNILDPNNMMLITVFDNKIATDKLSVFHGWMMSNNLSISSLEHPVYELIPKRCLAKNSNK